MAEAVRAELDPTEWVAFELAIARDEQQPLETRRASWLALIDRGFVKAPTTIDVTTGPRDELDFSALDVDVARAELARLEALASGQRDTVPRDQRLHEPSVPDDTTARDTSIGTPTEPTP